MNISVCTTVFNEEESIGKLLDSFLVQSKKADEIIIVDGGSIDKTVEIIRHYQKKDNKIKLLVEKCSRSRGRNLAIEIAKNKIIAMTDAGCIARPDWLKNISESFLNDKVEVVAGFYHMTALNAVGRAMSIFMGVLPEDFDVSFLPSTRSIAFKKSIWEKVGGFPENIEDTAEDTVFNYKLLKNSVKIVRVKNAVVEWGMPGTIQEFGFKIYEYAKGDAKSRIWKFPGKTFTSHNIHSLSIIIRYLLFLTLFVSGFFSTPSFTYLFICLYVICIFAYFLWSFRKVFIRFREVKVALWGPVLQISSDLAVITGFLSGIFNRNA